MRFVLLLSLVVGLAEAAAAQQAPATAKPAGATPQTQKPAPVQPQPPQKPAAAPPQTQKPAAAPPETQKPAAPSTQKPAQARRTTPAATRSGLAITVTDSRGATIPDVTVELMGPTARKADTNSSGQINFPGLQAGLYRLRFSGESVVTLERDVTVRAGQVTDVDVTLSAAPPPPPPPPVVAAPERDPEPEVVAPPVGPKGTTQILSLVDLLEREIVRGNQPRKDTLVACSGNTRSMLVQLNEPQAIRVYDGAETLYYVIAGEGTIQIDGRDVALEAGRYAALPRGTSHALTRRGRRPLVLLAVLSGEPCEESK
jgi:hypothetical protein